MSKYTWFAILISTVVLIAGSLTIVYFSIYPKEDLLFLGRHNINSQDVYTYVSFIEQGRQGRLLFENLYTTEQQKPSLLRPSYLVLGQFARVTGVSSLATYHIFRVIFGIIFMVVLYRFLDYFFSDEKAKFIAFVLILTSSGLGFLFFKYFPNSTDLWIPEGNTFLALSEAPHFILSQALMLSGFISFFEYLKRKNLGSIVTAFLLFLLLSFEHPFNLIVAVPVIFVVAIWSKVKWQTAMLLAGGSGAGLIYQFISAKVNPILAAWNSQNILISPPLANYLLGYGLILVLAVAAVEKALNDKLTTPVKFAVTWVAVTGLLLYAPVNFQRRMVEGVHIPLSILASTGIMFLVERFKKADRGIIASLTILFLSGSSIYSVYSDFKTISGDGKSAYYHHITHAEYDGIKWLGARTKENDIILSNWYLGNLIPGIAGRKVYLGHQIQTINWDFKNKAIDEFTHDINKNSSLKFLADNHITYIFVGINDVFTQNGFKAENYSNIKTVYNKDGVAIYKVY